MKPFRVRPVPGIVPSGGDGVMMQQERFEDACDEYDRVLRLLNTMVKRLEAK